VVRFGAGVMVYNRFNLKVEVAVKIRVMIGCGYG